MIIIKLQDAYQQFVSSRETFCSDQTVSNYANRVRYFVEYLEYLKQQPATALELSAIELSDLNNYSIYLKSKPKNDGHPFYPADSSKKISSRTRYSYLQDMRTFLNYLRDEGEFSAEILSKFRMPKKTSKVLEPLMVEEVELIDEHIKSNKVTGVRNLCIFHFLLDEGMRTSEIYKLKLSDINFRKNYIVIRNSKGSKNRILPLAQICKEYALDYVNNYRPDVVHDYFICKLDGQPLNQGSIKNVFDRIKASTGINRIYPHLLRHTFGTSFILGGGSLELCRHYMGHSDIKTTENYLHIANDYRFCEGIYRLDEIFKKSFY